MVINQESTLEPPAAWQTEVPGKTGNDSETHPASAKSGEVIKVKMPLGRPEVSPLGSRYLRTGTTWSICLGGGLAGHPSNGGSWTLKGTEEMGGEGWPSMGSQIAHRTNRNMVTWRTPPAHKGK